MLKVIDLMNEIIIDILTSQILEIVETLNEIGTSIIHWKEIFSIQISKVRNYKI
jgi:hypothetical protein